MTFRSVVVLGLSAWTIVACGDEDKSDQVEETKNECPAELSYELVAEPFLDAHCSTCHAEKTATLLGDGHVIISEQAIREHGSHLYDLVESGEMPATGTPVPAKEKADFLDWMECSGATASGHEHEH